MRIISLVPSVTETLFELGLDEEIVAVTRFCKLPAHKVKAKPRVGGTKSPSLQKILELKPDMVIMDRDENRKQDAEFLQQQDVNIFAVLPKTLEDSIRLIEAMGELFHVEERALQICSQIKQYLEETPPVPRCRALILIWQNPYMSVNSDTYVNAICRHFGLDNIFGGAAERYPRLTEPEIEGADPDVVLFPDEPFPFRTRHVEQFRMRFPHLAAVRNNKLLLFDGTYVTWHGYGTLRALHEFPVLLKQFGLWQ